MAVSFTQRELDIMAVLWERGPSTVAEVRAYLDDGVSHNTIATMLNILESKGYARHSEEGRAFRYRATVEREEAGSSAFSRLIDTIFAGSAEAFITHFVRDRRLSTEELARIREIVDGQINATGDDKPAPRKRRR